MKELETTKRKTKTKRSMVLFVCVQCVPKEIANEYTHSLTNLFILPLFSKHSQLKAPGTEGDEGKATKGVQYRLVVSLSESRRKGQRSGFKTCVSQRYRCLFVLCSRRIMFRPLHKRPNYHTHKLEPGY